MDNIEYILQENTKRNLHKNREYDPQTGIGSYGERVRFEIEDAPFPLLYLPKPMLQDKFIKVLSKYKSFQKMYEANGLEFDEEERQNCWIDFCEIRIKYDFEYYAYAYETIEDGISGEMIPFRMNLAQRKFNEIIMDDLMNNRPVRIINLKARQHGISTYIQILFSWIQKVKKKRWNSVICAHVNDAAKNIRSMYTRSMEYTMPIGGIKYTVSPFEQTSNIKEIRERGCRITVGSAEKPESVRSQNPKLAHFSEVAFYPNTDKKQTTALIGSILGTMKLSGWTVVIYESTANGFGDFFQLEYAKAKKGESSYTPVFLAWFYNPNYNEVFDGTYYTFSGKKTKGTIEDFIRSMNDYEKNLFNNHEDCTLENLNWYRGKNGEMTSRAKMKQEFPSDDNEAFQDSGRSVFRDEDIERMRSDCRDPQTIGYLVADADASVANTEPTKRKAILENIRFVEDPEAMEAMRGSDVKLRIRKTQDRIKIWRMPSTIKIRHRYVVVFDPQKGITEKADWGVIAVIDRLPMMSGEKPEIVAQFRGHIDKDITIWIAMQIAKWYNNALLVVESNTYDQDNNSRDDDSEMIFEVVKQHYDNLYTRTPADKVREGYPIKWGFNTNRATKPMIINNYISVIREDGYVERDNDALDEARMYEQKEDGKYGAKEGQHDDIIMTRMIGLYIAYNMPIPEVIDENRMVRPRNRSGAMSDI